MFESRFDKLTDILEELDNIKKETIVHRNQREHCEKIVKLFHELAPKDVVSKVYKIVENW